MEFEPVIGLEVHAQLLTDSKIFCSCSTKFGSEPNSQVCPICLGMPGVLPVLNKKAVEFTALAGLATNCKVNAKSRFARKNYFYPDLPKGYQISQYEEPLCIKGYLNIETPHGIRKVHITRIHLEEDAGKLIHEVSQYSSFVDLNRTGVPLIEIVSEPEMSSADEAVAYMKKLRSILMYIGVCDGNMEEGSLRCDANVSVRPEGTNELGTKAEIKNINSFRFVQKAIEYEIERQLSVIENGGTIIQETRLFDSSKGITFSMRTKEEAHDYRYFPDPDLLPVMIDDNWLDTLKVSLPELPDSRYKRFMTEYELSESNALILTSSKQLADYFEQCLKYLSNAKLISNWIINDVIRETADSADIENFKIKPKEFSSLLSLVDSGEINTKIAKEVFAEMLESGLTANEIVNNRGLKQISDTGEIDNLVDEMIKQYKDEVDRYRQGDQKLLGFFVGQIMKVTKGKANPKIVNELLKEKLS